MAERFTRTIDVGSERSMVSPGIVLDRATDTYVRLRRGETLRFDVGPRRTQAVLGNAVLTWANDHETRRQEITDWWLNRKDT